MANVPESPNFEAIICAGVGNGFFTFAMPQRNPVYFEPTTPLVADIGLPQGTIQASQYPLTGDVGENQAFIEPAIHLLLGSEVNGPYQSSFDLLKSETNGPIQGTFDLLKSETVLSDASLNMLAETPIVIVDSIDTRADPFHDGPPPVARTPKSGGSFCGF